MEKHLTLIEARGTVSSMSAPRPLRQGPEDPAPLHDHALESLRFIRSTMEASTAFTAVPGRGMVVMGIIAVAAASLAARQGEPRAWLLAWVTAGAIAAIAGLAAMALKARAADSPLLVGSGRRFALAFLPPVLAAAALTLALANAGRYELLPGLWMLLYGVAALAGGTFSVRAIPLMGACFALAGLAMLFAPRGWGDLALALTFGALHVVFGVVVWRRHGG